ncbi:MAG: hypothetical protein KBG28_28720 [Kofleriaceae bacterium]|jgi:hypothetical protein|nr:hypothetical protein [Kofleriaceae bacterium]MBP6838898.1 hypothetical protein [Kofleriaceae bacterium]MBP9207984.1 hypothetical protein [Kofleriaceae bacterium]
MSFPWLDAQRTGSADGAARRADALRRDLAHRAALHYRLGASAADATRRLCANLAWEFEPSARAGAHQRPAALSDAAVAELVAAVYARRPS